MTYGQVNLSGGWVVKTARFLGAWKVVDYEHASIVETGALRIGTFSSYRSIENGRADQLDGGVEITASSLFGGDDRHRAAMARLGLGHLGRKSAVVGCTFTYMPEPKYIFCMTEPKCRYDPKPAVKKQIFAISHVGKLAAALTAAHPDKLGAYKIDVVKYQRRQFDALEPTIGGPDPFIKSTNFQREREIRIVWEPAASHQVNEPFISKPNLDVSRLLKRIV